MSVGTVRDSHDVTASRKDWLGLVVLAFAVLLISVDATVPRPRAVPFISEDLEPSSTQLLWISTLFVRAGGSAGDDGHPRRPDRAPPPAADRCGRLRPGVVDRGVVVESGDADRGACAPGCVGATLMPATLGLIRTMFVDPRQRTTAIGVWGAMAGWRRGGRTAGRWLVARALLVGFGLPRHNPGHDRSHRSRAVGDSRVEGSGPGPLRSGERRTVDAGHGADGVRVKETAVHGPSWVLTAVGVVGLAAGWAFVRRQKTLADPMID